MACCGYITHVPRITREFPPTPPRPASPGVALWAPGQPGRLCLQRPVPEVLLTPPFLLGPHPKAPHADTTQHVVAELSERGSHPDLEAWEGSKGNQKPLLRGGHWPCLSGAADLDPYPPVPVLSVRTWALCPAQLARARPTCPLCAEPHGGDSVPPRRLQIADGASLLFPQTKQARPNTCRTVLKRCSHRMLPKQTPAVWS